MDDRLEALERGVYDLLFRSVAGSHADDPIVIACRNVVRTNVPQGSPVLVAGKSDPAFLELYGRTASNFPQDRTGRYPGFPLANSQALVAHLEALRYAGSRFLLIPSPSRWLLDHYSSFGEHLLDRYRIVASGSGTSGYSSTSRTAEREQTNGRAALPRQSTGSAAGCRAASRLCSTARN